MKAITLHEPYASAIAWGLKRYETRSWQTRYRGLLAIHASKKQLKFMGELRQELWFVNGVRNPVSESPGCVVAVVRLVSCAETIQTCLRFGEIDGKRESRWGDWMPGRFAWRLEDVYRLRRPLRCRGFQGLWDLPLDLVKKIEEERAAAGPVQDGV